MTSQERARGRGIMARLLREPLMHFLVAGLAIFAVAHWIEWRSQRYVIRMDADAVQRIASSYVQQYGTAPTPAQMSALLDNAVREEIFLREGLALGLDRDDEIVRRRIAQKFQFLQADMAVPGVPSNEQLRHWFTAHRARYAIPARRSFAQLYFAIDQRGEGAAKSLAEKALAELSAGGPMPRGDEFPGPKVIRLLSQADTDRLFGGTNFASAIFAAPKDRWAGPYRSGFGWHVIRVTEAEAPQPRSFEAAETDARADWTEAQRRALNRARYMRLLAQYQVIRP